MKPLDEMPEMCYYIQAVRTNGFLPQKPENCITGMRGWRNWQTRTFEVRVVYPWGFESPPSHQKASRFLTCLFSMSRSGGMADTLVLGTSS